MLKKNVTTDEAKIYELYFLRIMKEYDLLWGRFKIYFGFNAGVLVVIGFLLKPYLSTNPFNIPNPIMYVISGLCFIGIMFSYAWHLVNKDGLRWMLLMNNVIKKAEVSLFQKPSEGLYNKIMETYEKKKQGIDVGDINQKISIGFILMWFVLGILSAWELIFNFI